MAEENTQVYLKTEGAAKSEADRDAEFFAKDSDGQAEDSIKEAAEDPAREAKRLEKERKRREAIQRTKSFLYENRDVLILSGQLALVVLVCTVGIKNDLMPDGCCKKKKKKRKK